MPATDPPARSRIVPPLLLIVLAVLLVGLMGYGLYAREKGSPSDAGTAATAGEPLTWIAAQGTSLPGVGRVEGLAMPCTAWLLDTGTTVAYAVTAGRCAGIDDSGTVLSDVAVDGAQVTFRMFDDAPGGARSDPVTAPVDQITWASMRGTDLAVLRLATPASDLAAAGIPAIPVGGPLAEGGELLVAGVPVAGGADGSALRGTRCQAGARVSVAEGPWLLRSPQAADCTGIVSGSAGSPALDAAGAAVGMVATTTIAAPSGAPCQQRTPCELDSGMVSVRPDTSYLVDLSGLDHCFGDAAFRLGSGCPLEDPATAVSAQLGSSRVPAGDPISVTVDPAEQSVGAWTQVRAGMLVATDCWDQAGWTTAPIDNGQLQVSAPAQQGLALVCVGSPAQPTPLMLTVTAAGPAADLVRLTERSATGGVTITPVLSPPEVAAMSWTIEPGTGASCAVVEGYVAAPSTGTFIPAHDLPATVCAIAADGAGNTSRPVAIPVGVSGTG
jgi:Trypsin-like peptidase domain